MSRRPKSYWSGVACSTERDKIAIRSWFQPLCNDMTPEKAEILCDIETDRERKLRAVMVQKNGTRCLAERTVGVRTFSIRIKSLPSKGSSNGR